MGAPNGVLLRDVRVFDGTRVISADSVLVRGDVIAEVGRGIPARSAVQVIDGSGCTLLPGLIDGHGHAMRVENLAQALAFGVTTVLDMFCVSPHLDRLREAAASGADVADFRSADRCDGSGRASHAAGRLGRVSTVSDAVRSGAQFDRDAYRAKLPDWTSLRSRMIDT